MAIVAIRDLVKKYGALEVVHGINIDIENGELLVLVGPSGCGKSTILRMIAGLEPVTAGKILIGDRVVNDVPPKDRDIAMVFQDYALYPHMSVHQNIGFGLKMRGISRDDVRARVADTASILQIDHLLNRKPKQLSGGQRQRVAMGRAIIRQPEVFLFDEPLSNLDAKLRTDMRTQIKRLHMTIGTTSIYVTHDQVEAMTLADRIVVLRDGVVEQIGRPRDLYETPANKFVAGFIGSPTMNFIPARLVAAAGICAVEVEGGTRLAVPDKRADRYAAHIGREITLGIRPEHITDPLAARGQDGLAPVDVAVDVAEPLGSDTMVFGRLGSREIVARVSPDAVGEIGSTMRLHADMNRIHLFDPQSEKTL